MNVAIAEAARYVAATKLDMEQASAAREGASAGCDRINQRIAALYGERSEIIARRQREGHLVDDGSRLALITADLEGLTSVLADAEAIVTTARATHQQAQQGRSAAEYQLQSAEDEVLEGALLEHAARLETLLLETIGHLDEVNKRRGDRAPKWASRPLYEKLRRQLAERNEL